MAAMTSGENRQYPVCIKILQNTDKQIALKLAVLESQIYTLQHIKK